MAQSSDRRQIRIAHTSAPTQPAAKSQPHHPEEPDFELDAFATFVFECWVLASDGDEVATDGDGVVDSEGVGVDDTEGLGLGEGEAEVGDVCGFADTDKRGLLVGCGVRVVAGAEACDAWETCEEPDTCDVCPEKWEPDEWDE